MPEVFPAMCDETAAGPLPLPVVVETGPQVGHDPDILVSGWDIEVGVMDITEDIRVLPDVFPAMFDETTAVPLVADRRVTTPAAIPLVDEMTLRVTTVGLSNDESVRPVAQFEI